MPGAKMTAPKPAGAAATGPAPNVHPVRSWTAWLLDRGENRFGLLAVGWLLLFATILALIPFEHAAGPRADQTVTLLSGLPESWLRSPAVFAGVRVWLLVSAVAWLAWLAVPWSCWSTVAAFAALWSLRMENVTNGAHIFNATNTLLCIHAMWFHFYGQELRQARQNGQMWNARLYPRWAFWLSVFYLGWFHSLAGFTKIVCSGWGWGNGTSLQLWMSLFAEPSSPLTWPILHSRTLAAVLQTGALIIECASILCILGRWPRYIVGLALIGFYSGVLGTFTLFGFHFNWMLVAWFLLPADRWLGLEFLPTADSPTRDS